ERPCEKLCRTCPVSTGLRSPSVPAERRVNGRFCSWSCSFASVIRSCATILWLRPGRSRTNIAVDHCTRAKAGEPLQIEQQPAAQQAPADRDVHGPVATKGRAEFMRVQHRRHRQAPRRCIEPATSALRAVKRNEQQRYIASPQGFADPLKTGLRET